MPGFDQTGPVGQGPMTGRRMGRCTGFGARAGNQPAGEAPRENIPFGYGRGAGYGRRGGGRGWNRGMGLQNRFRGNF
ncbi:MAG: DUF5320 domain-containing protein [Tenuifilaceae bacterium]|nr:DUF5320 domain-containing protein [Bacteroidales bacterium]MDI9515362.1 DUF5320 domain-containing protein [Bacteroidota bacterium]NLH56299.1 DUF5320 domain-containing protein [Rikenellaceae bacterium]HNV81912.1 DUF5320 domain-containing protein [Tenuifilaceae bacterium]MZP81371.1 hypothetical protein [Bacteroidales bacterium]